MKRIPALALMLAGTLGYAMPSHAATGTVCTHIAATYTAAGGEASASLVVACPAWGNRTFPQIYTAGYRVVQVLGPFVHAYRTNATTAIIEYRFRWDVVIEKP
jgi:hypothetical protein